MISRCVWIADAVPETLGQKQERFSTALATLIRLLNEAGYGVRLKEVWRTPEQAALNAQTGKGIANSLHCVSLAADMYLSRFGAMVPETKTDYAPMGNIWKSLGPDHAWGGDFARLNDIYHISIRHEGRA